MLQIDCAVVDYLDKNDFFGVDFTKTFCAHMRAAQQWCREDFVSVTLVSIAFVGVMRE